MNTRGGVSKAQKGLHLNEDIFPGMNAFGRGGRIKHMEYYQCGKGRDLGFGTILNFQTKLGTGIRYADIQALNLYWSQVRIMYGCFEANVRASDSSVFDHEMPGGQYTNLMVRHSSLECEFN